MLNKRNELQIFFCNKRANYCKRKNSILMNASPYYNCVVICINANCTTHITCRPILYLMSYFYDMLTECINYMLWYKELGTYSHPVMHLTLLTSISWSMICRTTCNFPPNSCANISFWIYIQNHISNTAQNYFAL